VDLDVIFFDRESRPNTRHQLILADHLTIRRGQHPQNVASPVAELHREAVALQLPLAQIEPKTAEIDLVHIHQSQPPRLPIQNN